MNSERIIKYVISALQIKIPDKEMEDKFNKAFKQFFDGAVQIFNKEYKDDVSKSKLIAEDAKRYVKIFKTDTAGSKSAWAFIDKNNGDVLKPASWRAPAKGARGNIFDQSKGLKRIGPYGPAYNR